MNLLNLDTNSLFRKSVLPMSNNRNALKRPPLFFYAIFGLNSLVSEQDVTYELLKVNITTDNQVIKMKSAKSSNN